MISVLPTSPKRHDLRRDGRYALHSTVSDPGNTSGEFVVQGHAREVDDPEVRALAPPEGTYTLLFELYVTSVLSTVYENGQPIRRRWPGG